MADEMTTAPTAHTAAPQPLAATATGVADPAPLGLGAFALTTFVLSVHNAGWAPDVIWMGLAFFYGGLAQFAAGMWEFKNRNTFGATAFTTYGAFWLALGFFEVVLIPRVSPASDVSNDLGWFILAFAIFNTYVLVWSSRVTIAIFLVFLTLEITEVLLFVGYFTKPPASGFSVLNVAGIVGIVTALTAWYASAAGVGNGLARRPLLPVGRPFWT